MIIAERTLSIRAPEGDLPVPIRVFAPEPGQGDFVCRYEIDWPDRTYAGRVYGIDSMQALVFALVGLQVHLEVGARDADVPLRWGGRGAPFGLPVMVSADEVIVPVGSR